MSENNPNMPAPEPTTPLPAGAVPPPPAPPVADTGAVPQQPYAGGNAPYPANPAQQGGATQQAYGTQTSPATGSVPLTGAPVASSVPQPGYQVQPYPQGQVPVPQGQAQVPQGQPYGYPAPQGMGQPANLPVTYNYDAGELRPAQVPVVVSRDLKGSLSTLWRAMQLQFSGRSLDGALGLMSDKLSWVWALVCFALSIGLFRAAGAAAVVNSVQGVVDVFAGSFGFDAGSIIGYGFGDWLASVLIGAIGGAIILAAGSGVFMALFAMRKVKISFAQAMGAQMAFFAWPIILLGLISLLFTIGGGMVVVASLLFVLCFIPSWALGNYTAVAALERFLGREKSVALPFVGLALLATLLLAIIMPFVMIG